MAATLTPGYTFGVNEQVTNVKLGTLVSGATITGVDQTNLASGYGLVITSVSEPSNVNALWLDSASSNLPKYYNGSAWTSVVFTPTAANALSGSVVQVKNVSTTALITGTTTMPNDDTIPQSGEGIEVFTLAITPTNASNLLYIRAISMVASNQTGGRKAMALFQDSTANALRAISGDTYSSPDVAQAICLEHWMTAGTTSATTFKIRVGSPDAGTITINGENGARLFGGVACSMLTITEIKA